MSEVCTKGSQAILRTARDGIQSGRRYFPAVHGTGRLLKDDPRYQRCFHKPSEADDFATKAGAQYAEKKVATLEARPASLKSFRDSFCGLQVQHP